MKVTIVGLGLIGGSIARDLRKKGLAAELIGVDASKENAARSMALGHVDRLAALEAGSGEADLVVLAVPVTAIESMLPKVLNHIQEDAVVVDTGSTKETICSTVSAHPRRDRFVAAHPIAGTENSGPEAALEGLFNNKINIVCEKERSAPDALDRAGQLFHALEMDTVYMDPKEHDKHVAYVSHLSHLSSFLLGQTVLDIERNEKSIVALAGSGFASTVRLAKSSPDMWAPIFKQNARYLKQALKEYIAHLQKFQEYLEAGDEAKMHEVMQKANDIRRVLEGIEFKNHNTLKSKTLTIEK